MHGVNGDNLTDKFKKKNVENVIFHPLLPDIGIIEEEYHESQKQLKMAISILVKIFKNERAKG